MPSADPPPCPTQSQNQPQNVMKNKTERPPIFKNILGLPIPPELPFPPGLYSAHKINPNIMKNRTKRSPIFKNAPKFLYRCLALFPTGGHIFWYVCVESDLKWEQNGVIMRPLAPF